MKQGRNEPCACKSGLKYKKCCWIEVRNQQQKTRAEMWNVIRARNKIVQEKKNDTIN